MPTLKQIIKNKSSSNRLSKKKFVVAKALNKRPQLRGVCIKIYTTKPKKPNSANRKVAKLKLSTGKKIIAYVNGSGHNLQQHSVVMVRGGRRRDLPGIHYQLIRGKYDFTIQENFIRSNRRSKFSTKKIKKNILKMAKYYIGLLTKKGFKNKAKKIFYSVLFEVSNKTFQSYSVILNTIYYNCSPIINMNYIRKSGQSYPIPTKINYKRSLSLTVHWVIESAKKRKNFKNLKNKLVAEFLDILQDKGYIYSKRLEFHKKAIANRFFIKSNFKARKKNSKLNNKIYFKSKLKKAKYRYAI